MLSLDGEHGSADVLVYRAIIREDEWSATMTRSRLALDKTGTISLCWGGLTGHAPEKC